MYIMHNSILHDSMYVPFLKKKQEIKLLENTILSMIFIESIMFLNKYNVLNQYICK